MKRNIIILSSFVILFIASQLLLSSNRNKFVNPKSKPTSEPKSSLKTYKSSDVMDFMVDIPIKYGVEEKVVSVLFATPEGNITITRSSTPFNTIEEYVDDLLTKNNTKLADDTSLEINNLKAIKGFIDNRLDYFIYADNYVYLLTTDNEALYDDLDQIAQSFRYTPD